MSNMSNKSLFVLAAILALLIALIAVSQVDAGRVEPPAEAPVEIVGLNTFADNVQWGTYRIWVTDLDGERVLLSDFLAQGEWELLPGGPLQVENLYSGTQYNVLLFRRVR